VHYAAGYRLKPILFILLTGCGGATFGADIPPPTDDASPEVSDHQDSGPMSDAVEAEAKADSSTGDGPSESTALDMGSDAPCTPITHVNGLGQGYKSCTPLGTPGVESTYTYAMGALAALAWNRASGSPGDTNCGAGTSACRVIMSDSPPYSAAWCYTGTLAGYVATGSAWPCPTTASPTWN